MVRRWIAVLLSVAASVAAPAQEVLQTVEREGVVRVVVSRAGIFDVSVKGYSGSSVHVEVRSSSPEDRIVESLTGGELTISPERGDRVRSIGSRAPELLLRVPEATALSIETGTGGILVETVAGAKSLGTASGGIVVRSSRGSIEARSSTGSQRYDYVTGDIRAESATGAIELTNVEGRADLQSATGRLWGRNVRVTADSRLRTSTGRIEIDFANPLEDFTFVLQSVTGLIDVGGTEARGKVQRGSGPLRITGQTTTGRQTYR